MGKLQGSFFYSTICFGMCLPKYQTTFFITMNRILSFIFALFLGLPAMAQYTGDGYYRVQNMRSERYIVMIDNKSKGFNASTTSYDMDALVTIKEFERVVSDPGSVIYIEHYQGNQYNLKAQGTDAYSVVGRYLTLTPKEADTYWASATEAGITLYLFDTAGNEIEGRLTTQKSGTEFLRRWYLKPISASDDDNYFGIPADVVADGKQYSSLYVSFPFTFASSGMKAYTVTKIDGNLAVMTELEGKVAAKTPVIIACAGSDASDNRINIEMQNTVAPSGNLLKGLFFENSSIDFINDNENAFHFNATKYDPNTMRLLGKTSSGKLGFVKASVKYVPKNRAYITVPAGSPDEITLLTQAEYEEEIAKDAVVVTARNYSREYGEANPTFEYDVTGTGTMQGQPAVTCEATPSSPVGTYPILVRLGTVSNHNFTGINGTLTVNAAPLTVKARSYTIQQGQELPAFAYDITGFKLDETEAVLTTKPTITCNVPDNMTPGTYPITVSGAAAQNYNISYVAGTLTIQEAPLITVWATSVGKVYGNEMPELKYTIEGGTLTGTPELKCEATQSSPVGNYDIIISQGTLQDYANIKFVNGVLAVAKAPLTITARSYTIMETDDLPSFAYDIAGFKLNETESVLTTKPTVSCDVPEEKTPGTYSINVSGATAQNYEITHKPGTLTIQALSPVIVRAASVTKAYGDPNPAFTYTIEGGELTGTPAITCEATLESEPGVYTITISQGTLQDYPYVTFVNGTLTVTKAPLSISAGGPYTMTQADERPEFKPVFEGFKLGQDESVLDKQPVLTTDAPDDNTPGEYTVTVSGAESSLYYFLYRSGKLIITEADQIVIMASDASMVYGDEVPQLIFTVSGGEFEGEPVLSCEATSRSDAGSYDIIVSLGTVDYPNVKLINGTLTIGKAPLKASVGSYVRDYGEENPVFEVQYEGFRNGDTPESLEAAPVALTSATIDSMPGTYDIVVSGGEARNYEFTYVNGVLTVSVPEAIQVMTFSRPVDVYTLTGRKVRSQVTTTKGLSRGVYIIEGRKVVVK